ncbi:G-patch domain-containing protein [Erysiphe neolycopersici]|uniref:G-patch domain-containing protein n=1 Tax=Erysiphe neolycopersici TaxID=212602 RepID=A0A420HAS4_9PEZI|nr:G-patch domain-containing protein [Erysiphe neolycopersici]
MSYISKFEQDSSSESLDEIDNLSHTWHHNDENEFANYHPRKKRRIQRISKAKAALGVFGSDSDDDDGSRKKWNGINHLKRRGVEFVSTREHGIDSEENKSLISRMDDIRQKESAELNKSIQVIENDSADNKYSRSNILNYSQSIPKNPDKSKRLLTESDDAMKSRDNASIKPKESFAARMMAKMGYKNGEGLGKESQGRNSVIEVTLRPQGIGLGAIREKSTQEINEERRQAKIRGTSSQSSGKDRNKILSRATISQDSDEENMIRPKKPQNPRFKTLAEVHSAAPGLQVPDSFTKILDMTIQGQGKLTSLTEIKSFITKHEVNECPERRKLAQRANNDLSAYIEEWKTLEKKKSHIKLTISQQRENITKKQLCYDDMQLLSSKLDYFSQLVKDMRWDHMFEALETSTFTSTSEFQNKVEEISKIAVAAVHPFLRQAVEEWDPLDDPELGGVVPKLLRIRKALGVDINNKNSTITQSTINTPFQQIYNKTSTAYESMIFKIIYPKILNSIERKWDVYDPMAVQNLLGAWEELLPPFIRYQIVNKVVVRKLNSAVSSWNPKHKRAHKLPHLWLFPWLQYLPVYHADPQNTNGLVSNIKRKFRQLVDSWDFHKGVVPGLHQWRDVLHASSKNDQWTPLIMNHVLPSMSKFLKNENNFMINPNDQAPFMSSLQGILEWQDILKSRIVAQVIVESVFPLWHNVLHQWLILAGPNEEIGLWFEWWKNEVFPDEIKGTKIIQDEFDKGHEMIKQALDLGSRVTELLPAPISHSQLPDLPVKPILSPVPQISDLDSLRNKVETWCAENDLQFLPEKKIFYPTGLLHRITAAGNGKNGALVSIKGDKIWALSKKGQEFNEIEITWEKTDSKDLLLGMAWHNVK